MRAKMSVVPPGENGTTILMVLDAWDQAPWVASATRTVSAAAPAARCRKFRRGNFRFVIAAPKVGANGAWKYSGSLGKMLHQLREYEKEASQGSSDSFAPRAPSIHGPWQKQRPITAAAAY